ncbi:MAG: hypothetical protein HQ594_05225, partial [Candidatus Omnitrophica bacterium]|nr:hypothetical protein [Candidatus Omnitrophota bacterium]
MIPKPAGAVASPFVYIVGLIATLLFTIARPLFAYFASYDNTKLTISEKWTEKKSLIYKDGSNEGSITELVYREKTVSKKREPEYMRIRPSKGKKLILSRDEEFGEGDRTIILDPAQSGLQVFFKEGEVEEPVYHRWNTLNRHHSFGLRPFKYANEWGRSYEIPRPGKDSLWLYLSDGSYEYNVALETVEENSRERKLGYSKRLIMNAVKKRGPPRFMRWLNKRRVIFISLLTGIFYAFLMDLSSGFATPANLWLRTSWFLFRTTYIGVLGGILSLSLLRSVTKKRILVPAAGQIARGDAGRLFRAFKKTQEEPLFIYKDRIAAELRAKIKETELGYKLKRKLYEYLDEFEKREIIFHIFNAVLLTNPRGKKAAEGWILGFNTQTPHDGKAKKSHKQLQDLLREYFREEHGDTPVLGISQEVFRAIYKNGSLFNEYLFHEIMCPHLGHERTRQLQEKIFPENYEYMYEHKENGHIDGKLALVLRSIVKSRRMKVYKGSDNDGEFKFFGKKYYLNKDYASEEITLIPYEGQDWHSGFRALLDFSEIAFYDAANNRFIQTVQRISENNTFVHYPGKTFHLGRLFGGKTVRLIPYKFYPEDKWDTRKDPWSTGFRVLGGERREVAFYNEEDGVFTRQLVEVLEDGHIVYRGKHIYIRKALASETLRLLPYDGEKGGWARSCRVYHKGQFLG